MCNRVTNSLVTLQSKGKKDYLWEEILLNYFLDYDIELARKTSLHCIFNTKNH